MYIMLNDVSGRNLYQRFFQATNPLYEPAQYPGSTNRRSILLTIYIYGYLNRIKTGPAIFAYGASKDSIDLRNHLHRCILDRSFIAA